MADEVPLVMWVVTRRPIDFPEDFVVRKHHVTSLGSFPTRIHRAFRTLEDARHYCGMELGLICVARDPEDDPVIVETWL